MDICSRLGNWPVDDAIDFLGVWFDPMLRDVMPQKIHLAAEEGTFLDWAVKIRHPKGLQDEADIPLMLFQWIWPDDYIVEVDMTDFANKWAQGGEHSLLVYRWGVAQPHRHDKPFIQAERCVDSSVLYGVRVHFGLKKWISHVDFAVGGVPDSVWRLGCAERQAMTWYSII
jgi:hypothetical protein